MVVEWLFSLVAAVVEFILGLLPDLPDSGWLSGGVASTVGTISSFVSGFGAWIPFGAAATATTFVLAVLAAAVLVKTVRIVASFFTAGGGSAA